MSPEEAKTKKAFLREAKQLADFAMNWLINPFPKFLRSIAPNFQEVETVERYIHFDDLVRHFRSVDGDNLLLIPSNSPFLVARWVVITVFATGGRAYADPLSRIIIELEESGVEYLATLIKGMMQIWIPFSEPVPAVFASAVGEWFMRGWRDFRSADPIVAPKMCDCYSIGITSMPPLFGRHPNRDQWPAVLQNGKPIFGSAVTRKILSMEPSSPSDFPIEVTLVPLPLKRHR